MGGIFSTKPKSDGGAVAAAKQETEATKKKFEAEKMDMERTAAEQAAGRRRSGRRSSLLLSSARLGANGEQTLGSTQV